MKLFLISQDENCGYDTYDSAVVIAENEDDAKHSCVCSYHKYRDGKLYFQYTNGKEREESYCSDWTAPENVSVKYLGEAKEGSEAGVVCSSFNAG